MIMTRYSIKTNSLNNTLNRVNLFAAIRKRTGSSPRGGREGASAPAGLEEASILVGRVGAFLFLLLFLSLSFSSCSTDDEGGGTTPVDDGRQTVQLYLSVPSSNATRIGDPGQAVPEGEDWDKIAVMIEYAPEDNTDIPNEDKHSVIYVTKEDYVKGLDDNGYYWITLNLLPGTVHFYGVTYSEICGTELEGDIEKIANSPDLNESFANLEISNDYAMNDEAHVAKFLSVATGFYQDESGNLKDFVVEANPDWTAEDMPTMRLTRLAAKIDIQWDAQEAYGSAYSDIKVTGFTFSGDNENVTGSGSGRLFPSLNEGSEKLSGSKTFINQTPISQRNGRVYHYVFPDGVSTPKIVFYLSANHVKDDNQTENINGNYTFNFTGGALKKASFKKASWYKINTTISGLSNINISQDITFNDGSTQTADTGE